MPAPTAHPQRSRRDRCPGVFRPWPADDGGLVRLRLIGGRLSGESLAALGEVARTYGDGDVHLTKRANLQLRAMPATDGDLPDEVVEAIAATGLLPSRTHELVRNVMVSPETGSRGRTRRRTPRGRRSSTGCCCADPALAGAARTVPLRARRRTRRPGRAQLRPRADRRSTTPTAQLRVGREWGPVRHPRRGGLGPGRPGPSLPRRTRRGCGRAAGTSTSCPTRSGPGGHDPDPRRDDARPLLCRTASVDGGTHVAVPDGRARHRRRSRGWPRTPSWW